jgi:hypothetical protein
MRIFDIVTEPLAIHGAHGESRGKSLETNAAELMRVTAAYDGMEIEL